MAKIQIKEVKTVDVAFLQVSAGVRYWEDSSINGVHDTEEGALIPCRNGDRWEPRIDLDAGVIANWPKGTTANIHYKVCDNGKYSLLSHDGKIVKQIEGYVPDIMCPQEQGYGDYIIMKIDEDGKIEGFKVDLGDFEDESDD
jgi:hypothetical protein